MGPGGLRAAATWVTGQTWLGQGRTSGAWARRFSPRRGGRGVEGRTVLFFPDRSWRRRTAAGERGVAGPLPLSSLSSLGVPHCVPLRARGSPVQSLSRVRLCVTPWTAGRQASLSITSFRSLLKLVHPVGDAIQPSLPLSSSTLPALDLSQLQGLFQ